ncbi:MAG: HAD-IA family hydrolase [Clostridia bacterium]|nr:HAD-IA family hydrolase [Clostridia bacterium]
MIKAVILDMYGVILKDTGDSLLPYINETFPEKSFDDVYSYWNRCNVGELPSIEIFRGLGYEGDLEKIEKDYLNTIELNEDFPVFCEDMRGKTKLALISNDAAEWNRFLRNKYDLNKYFDVLHVSGELGIKKPDPDIFLLTLEKLGLKAEECVYVDDRRKNLYAAESLGMTPILFNTRNVDYDGIIIESFDDLKEYVLNN